ncbi:MAG TPA: hypothetical protein DCS36_13365 [Sphingobacterium sp.]|jgi:hypothetical protein|uniref:Uncharacterized protein n=1 Tax=Sphingobacterium multivorum TaxID=28454 RepID=A0A2X2LU23_SPHMU|nr:Uncharacterised protein [Sphingobacterium multivorum]SUJ89486.1 Uncharacterised protein [Sphingobacterium multivorum]HAT93343.1 hypothetical protein [Sphingobacterium sp.]
MGIIFVERGKKLQRNLRLGLFLPIGLLLFNRGCNFQNPPFRIMSYFTVVWQVFFIVKKCK